MQLIENDQMSPYPTFDVFHTEDGTVSKYIHEDGSETAIKLVKSVQNVLNPLTREIEEHRSERNKYSVFISSSVGCYMRCPFCHLTLKGAAYQKLTAETVYRNLQEALADKMHRNPELADRYVKLSWMGMGDAVNDPKLVMDVSLRILDWILARGYAKGVDGVDLSTVLPPVAPAWIEVFQNLDAALSVYPWNPIYAMDNAAFSSGDYTHRNRFRLFYSVHSAIQSRRDQVVPKAMPLAQAVAQLNQYAQDGRYTLILHHLLVEGLNDTEEELDALIDLVNRSFYGKELRILRYNLCTRSPYHESERFLAQVRKLADRVPFIKVQVSPGSEVSAACGQFIVKDFVRNRRQASAQV